MTRVTIIGAGIAGLVCAALARARGHAVTVVEAGSEAGGLWKSTEVTLGGHRLFLDAGLRLPVATGEARLDDAIFHRPDFAFDWTRFDGWPREGAITAHAFNAENSCLDATMLGEAVATVVAEMRACSTAADGAGEAASAQDHARRWYGPTLADGLVRDAVMGLFETALAELDTSAVTWFVPRRVILGNAAATAALLADPALSGRVAHARHADLPRQTSRPFLQPRHGGVSTWVTALAASLARDGVDFIMNDGLATVERDAARRSIARLGLRSGRTVEGDQVISTVAPALVARAAGAPAGDPPRFRHLRISHVLVDRAPGHRACYGLNFNRDPRFFRVIFHDNLNALPAGVHVLTFEHLVDDGDAGDLVAEAVAECRASGAVPAQTRVLDSAWQQYRNTMAVPTLAAARHAAREQDTVLAPLANLTFVGRAASGAPFLDQIIREADAAIAPMPEPHHV